MRPIVTPGEWVKALQWARAGEPAYLAHLIETAGVPDRYQKDVAQLVRNPPQRRRQRQFDEWTAGHIRSAYFVLRKFEEKPREVALDALHKMTGASVATLVDVIARRGAYKKKS
jgi:hypothetical protein